MPVKVTSEKQSEIVGFCFAFYTVVCDKILFVEKKIFTRNLHSEPFVILFVYWNAVDSKSCKSVADN